MANLTQQFDAFILDNYKPLEQWEAIVVAEEPPQVYVSLSFTFT